jgi:hypothetical protein
MQYIYAYMAHALEVSFTWDLPHLSVRNSLILADLFSEKSTCTLTDFPYKPLSCGEETTINHITFSPLMSILFQLNRAT